MTLPPLRSPASGRPLAPDTPHSLADGAGERWPVADGIPYLRTGRESLAAAALERLDEGDRDGALALLLTDQDDWWDGGPPRPEDLATLLDGRDRLSLRDAMRLLGYGRVGDYFAHRWTDPTFLAGLALVESHWTAPGTAFELACGIGHYLRELQGADVAVVGADVVFSKLWLARHWVLARPAPLVCFDAGAPWPIAELRADLVLCQDAFYFLEPKSRILADLRRVAGPAGTLAVGHVHNRDRPGFSSGAAVTAAEVAAFFPDGLVYDDDGLTRAGVSGTRPEPRLPAELADVEAFSIAAGPGRPATPAPCDGRLLAPARDGWRRNPLYREADRGTWRVEWPSERYREEYAPRATYPAVAGPAVAGGPVASKELARRRRELVLLPERW